MHLLRHGETQGGARYWGATDVRLSDRGWRQMESAVQALRWDRIVSSPLQRCRAFAEALARRSATPLTIDARLTEMHFGAWEGRSAGELLAGEARGLGRFWRDPVRHPPPGAEPFASFLARVSAAWSDIVCDQHEGFALVIAHGGPIRIILCTVRGIPVERLLHLSVAHGCVHSVGRRQ